MPEDKIPISLSTRFDENNSSNYIKLAWIQWKNYSCRIDAFATVAYHIFFYDFNDSIFPSLSGPRLPNELHPLGMLLREIDEAKGIKNLQKARQLFFFSESYFKRKKPKWEAIFLFSLNSRTCFNLHGVLM